MALGGTQCDDSLHSLLVVLVVAAAMVVVALASAGAVVDIAGAGVVIIVGTIFVEQLVTMSEHLISDNHSYTRCPVASMHSNSCPLHNTRLFGPVHLLPF